MFHKQKSGQFFPVILSLVLVIFASTLMAGCIGNTSWKAADWTEQGNRLAKDGLYSNAVEAYNQSLRLEMSNPKVYTYRGVAKQHMGDDTSAMQDFDQALKLNPNESAAWQGKAATYIDMGQYHLALKAADKALEQPSNPGDKVDNAFLLRGFALNRLELYDDAIQAFDKGIEISPKRIDLWQNKAYSLTKLGRYMEVLKCYEVMCQIDPHNAELWSKKGEIHLALGQINEANEAFSIAKGLIQEN